MKYRLFLIALLCLSCGGKILSQTASPNKTAEKTMSAISEQPTVHQEQAKSETVSSPEQEASEATTSPEQAPKTEWTAVVSERPNEQEPMTFERETIFQPNGDAANSGNFNCRFDAMPVFVRFHPIKSYNYVVQPLAVSDTVFAAPNWRHGYGFPQFYRHSDGKALKMDFSPLDYFAVRPPLPVFYGKYAFFTHVNTLLAYDTEKEAIVWTVPFDDIFLNNSQIIIDEKHLYLVGTVSRERFENYGNDFSQVEKMDAINKLREHRSLAILKIDLNGKLIRRVNIERKCFEQNALSEGAKIAVGNGRVHILSDGCHLSTLSSEDGALLWEKIYSVTDEDYHISPLVLGNDTLFWHSNSCTQRAVSAVNGEIIWENIQTDDTCGDIYRIFSFSDSILYRTDYFGVDALNPKNGEIMWQAGQDLLSESAALIIGNRILMGGAHQTDMPAYAVDKKTGQIVFRSDAKKYAKKQKLYRNHFQGFLSCAGDYIISQSTDGISVWKQKK